MRFSRLAFDAECQLLCGWLRDCCVWASEDTRLRYCGASDTSWAATLATTPQFCQKVCMRRFTVEALLFFTLGYCSPACKRGPPQPGAPCYQEGTALCVDSPSQMIWTNDSLTITTPKLFVCRQGKWFVKPCRGVAGCQLVDASSVKPRIICDTTVAGVGEPCGDGGELLACSLGHDALLHCKNGKWELIQKCLKGCKIKNDQNGIPLLAWCDLTIAASGDQCPNEGEDSCTADYTTKLTCRDGKWHQTATCRVPPGCLKGRGDPIQPIAPVLCDEVAGSPTPLPTSNPAPPTRQP
jgi:hypothetical protein